MQVRTFTSFWNTERKLYAFQDIALPFPISLRVAGVFLLTALPWWGLLILIQFPFNNPSYMLWFGVPIGVGFIATKPWFQGKTIFQYVRSMVNYYFQPKKMIGLRSPKFSGAKHYSLINRIFVRDEQLVTRNRERATV